MRMMFFKKITVFATLFAISLLLRAAPDSVNKTGEITGYEVDGKQVTFSFSDSTAMRLELYSDGIVKVWIDPQGTFVRNNDSYAVLPKEESGQVNVAETPQGYEVYTGDLIIRINKSPFGIRFFDKYQKLLLEDYQNKGFEVNDEYMSVSKTLRVDENIYGLGEKAGPLNRRGRSYKMWNSDKPCYGVNEDPLYKSIPFFMSNYGYGLFFDNTYKTTFDFGESDENYFTFATPGGEMVYYFLFGPTFKEIIARYTELTGKPIMPPKWALGFSQSRGMLTNEKLTRDIASGFRERNIPCDIIYQDIGWTQHLQDFEWRDGNYGDPVQMLTDLEDQGFKVIVSQDPVISQANTSQWIEADSLGYFTTDIRTGESYDMPWPWGGNCGVVDFTNPEVADWWGAYQQKVIDDGVRGFWTDMGEPAWSNEESSDRLNMKHHDGMHDEIHNVYGLTWDKVVTEQFEKRNPNTRIFQMTRAAFAGMQRYTFGWSGDAGNGFHVTEGWKQLANQVPLGLSAGMGGIPFWSCDISGYCGDIEDYDALGELYARWMQFGVFNPLSRAHHEGNNAVEPWLFGSHVEAVTKAAIELKYSLFPYIYTYARAAHDLGLPLMRAMFLEYPGDPETANLGTQFMFGEELLVAPVMEEAAATKRVYLPEGTWFDYHSPRVSYDGGQWIDFPVTLETIPLFVKQGSVVPTMPVMQYIHEDPDYPLTYNIFPSRLNRSASFEVYEDDGETNDYKKDVFVKRSVQCKLLQNGYEILLNEKVSNGFEVTPRDLMIRIHTDEKPAKISTSDGDKLKKGERHFEKGRKSWFYDKENEVCVIQVPASSQVDKLMVEF
ncbi:glycoside hydrolase family 31 protein [Marinilabilia salmonicolor]|uniref:Alpha-glucosidase n=1 Tax=Marinilabilia salmonicolor TaxID=989 RepID=A0A368V4K3_9BACT|nr:glycoside hydrolase family 31 protein [Marinilabilia salmonicolor]RCW34624.1 alpha-glucosidase [Marinilabilia salmonicolor]